MLKAFIKNINIINILLIFVAILIASYTFSPVSEKKAIKYKSISSVLRSDESGENTKRLASPGQPPADYLLIAENNPFHPERIIPVEEKTKAQPPLPKPEFILYGTLITDDIKIAYISDEKASISTAGRGKRQIPLRLGETLSGFTLKEVENDKVLMERGDERLYVHIYDPLKAKSRHLTSSTMPPEQTRQDRWVAPDSQQPPVQSQQSQPQVSVQPPSMPAKQPMSPEQARDAFMRLFQQKR
jgi:type II secretory pathway component PulC